MRMADHVAFGEPDAFFQHPTKECVQASPDPIRRNVSGLLREPAEEVGYRPLSNGSDRLPPKRLAVLREMAGNLIIGTRPQLRLASHKVFVDQCAECVGGCPFGVLLIERGVVSESNSRLELAGILAG